MDVAARRFRESCVATPPSNNSTGISTEEVIGVAVCAGVILITILRILFIFCKKKKRTHPADYCVPPPKVDPSSQQWHHNNPSNHHVIMMPPLKSRPPTGDHVIMMPPLKSRPPTGDHVIMMPLPPQELPQPMVGHCSMSGNNKTIFTYEDLANATEGFSHANCWYFSVQ
ncbi:hypothetical protein L1987_14608 [Smallanthus sonchifolius]|uniref:Uncharacterized protein n=1 Tax=Smallanthus sonchifolius TaxID=185202 RepID=A0ACB9J367_9ASTR|nr:hypothetical protein L1987_14608 [Smallanthus sonchifolius]